MTSTASPLVLHAAPASGLDQPFEMLGACHERVSRMLGLLGRLRAHLATHGADEQAAGAAGDVMRYFDLAAPNHHDDEERHVLPLLRAGGQDALADRLHADHQAMAAAWARLRVDLARVVARDGEPVDLAGLDGRADAFAALYHDHIPLEDKLAFPWARERMTPEALQAMSRDMAERRGVTPS